jgi:hypothetical protein
LLLPLAAHDEVRKQYVLPRPKVEVQCSHSETRHNNSVEQIQEHMMMLK